MQHGNGPDVPGHGGRPDGTPTGRPGGPGRRRRVDRFDADPDATRILGGGGGGRVLGGRYRLEGLLGTGGVSEVHRGTDLRLNRPVAVKLFRAVADREDARRLDEEARALANLAHPGLVSVYDAGVEHEQPYLVLELVDGWSLREVTAQEQLPLDEIVRIGVALADVLGYVHQQGIVHRDVKPSNVLIGRDNRVRLADFGTVRPRRAGSDVGTPAYLSPEQVRGEWMGPPADVYALGLVLLEAVTGRVEFPGDGPQAASARLARSPSVPAGLPDHLGRALLAMTDPDPQARPTAAQAAEMLRTRAEEEVVASAPGEQPRGDTTRQILVIALGAVLLALLIGLVAFATGDDESPSARSGPAATATRAPATTRAAPPPERAPERGTDGDTPRLPTSIALPDVEVPDLDLPDAPEIPTSVTDELKKAWDRFTDWLADLVGTG